LGFAGAVGALILVPTLSGCPGTLDPEVAKMASNGGSGGGATGGSTATGGATGTGGTSPLNCTGMNDGATIISQSCAQTYCHDASGATSCGGLDLTLDSGLAARLVGVRAAGTAANNSLCVGNTENYLDAGSNPATGLLIDKTKSTYPCGERMPLAGSFLTATQESCLIQWATTLTSP